MVAMALHSNACATAKGRPIPDARRIQLAMHAAIGVYMIGPDHAAAGRQFAHDLQVGILEAETVASGLSLSVARRRQI
jgi:hypothetical protein